MSNNAEDEDIQSLLMRVLDIVELTVNYRYSQNSQNIQLTQLSQYFMPGTVIGNLIEGSINGNGVIMGNKFEAHGQARVGNMGDNASIGSMAFGESMEVPANLNLDALAEELKELRAEMRRLAGSTEDDEAVVEVGKALSAVAEKDISGVGRHLKAAGKWALEVATTIGSGVAVAAIKAAGGL